MMNNALIAEGDIGEREGHDSESIEKLLTMTGGLMMGMPDSVVVRGTLASVKEHNLPHEVLTAEEIKNRYPAFRPSHDEIGILESEVSQ